MPTHRPRAAARCALVLVYVLVSVRLGVRRARARSRSSVSVHVLGPRALQAARRATAGTSQNLCVKVLAPPVRPLAAGAERGAAAAEDDLSQGRAAARTRLGRASVDAKWSPGVSLSPGHLLVVGDRPRDDRVKALGDCVDVARVHAMGRRPRIDLRVPQPLDREDVPHAREQRLVEEHLLDRAPSLLEDRQDPRFVDAL